MISLAWTINAFDQTPSYTTEYLTGLGVGLGCKDSVAYGYENSLSCKSYYMTHDLSGSWKTPWNGKVTLGVIT